MPDLLIELFSEEIPARMQSRAAADLQKLVTDGLVEAGLTYAHAAAFSTPRRLTLAVEGMLGASPRTVEERKGPKADAPEKAVEGFLRGAGVTRDQVEERETPKGTILFARIERPGRPAAEIVAEVLERTIRGFPWPKSMRWGDGALKWVRPLHSIICLITDDSGATVVPLELDGIRADDSTRGHRFMAPGPITVTGFEDYEAKLARAFVTLNPQARADTIWNDATNAAFASGMTVVEDAGLLAEVAGLVEWPVVLMGPIADEFLDLPPEVLQTSMREHQKFFSVKNPKTGRIEKFITVANRTTADEGATILAGNEKVLSARLSDAKFFWENDLRVATSDKGMQTWVDALSNVTFHNRLGTQAELIDRMALLARDLAPTVGAAPDVAEQAARLAKADLNSEMVFEFPELQGLMGRYYAEAARLPTEVAAAAQEHYAPLGPSDAVPTAPVSIAVALAEKIDKLTGFWAIDEKPTGSKDPFALRRAALGVIRILVENDVSLAVRFQLFSPLLGHLIREGSGGNTVESAAVIEGIKRLGYQHKADELRTLIERDAVVLSIDMAEKAIADAETKTDDLVAFLHDRLKVYLRDQGIRHDVIDACIAMEGGDDLTLLVKRARALNDVLKTDDGENLIQGFKRANNILTQAEEADGVEYSFGADIKFSETDEERALFAALDTAEARIKPAMAAQDFAAAMSAMAELRGPIDAFFDAVQVNSDNGTIRRNRLNLLSRIRTICTSVADLTRIDG
ncbi:Glycine--tRNA ligase beta subunit [Sulfitobacter sp. THAF37]|uniref:glycine--tRNA ligase subunit beta n=1 Tax=Sulfitobacter sp. THAF37 TaxID=2587855 RepID=UPI0012691ED1|nr:glycine--tRNA ligase subunit beta [Sulfitobacter sp. THAF37]QFT60413.1 Glycine--tRNA ligase beta subunit [Sulfitobacter sp. THAF37]